jgi:hypothetical protein
MTWFLLLSDSCGFVDVVRPLWRKTGTVLYNCCWSSSAQSFSGPSHDDILSQIPDSPNMEVQVPVFISRRNRWRVKFTDVFGRICCAPNNPLSTPFLHVPIALPSREKHPLAYTNFIFSFFILLLAYQKLGDYNSHNDIVLQMGVP